MTRKAKEKRIRKFMIKYALTRKEARESTALWDKCVKEVEVIKIRVKTEGVLRGSFFVGVS